MAETETEKQWDVRTTPPWLRPFAVVFLVGIIIYSLAGFHYVFRDRAPPWLALGYWSMFTAGGYTNSVLEAEGTWGDERRPIDLAELFPTRWESGYRFSRSGFKNSTGRLSTLGAAACNRIQERTGDPPNMIDFTLVRWVKVLGSTERKQVTRTHKLAWDCRRAIKLPNGRLLLGPTPKHLYPARVRKPNEPPRQPKRRRGQP